MDVRRFGGTQNWFDQPLPVWAMLASCDRSGFPSCSPPAPVPRARKPNACRPTRSCCPKAPPTWRSGNARAPCRPPARATGSPGRSDIARLEAALPAALAAERRPADWSGFPEGWRRQYIGLVRGGRRFVYGNFYPLEVDRHAGNPDRWRSEPVMVCDGGPVFFGVEYDVEANRVTHLAFNGIV